MFCFFYITQSIFFSPKHPIHLLLLRPLFQIFFVAPPVGSELTSFILDLDLRVPCDISETSVLIKRFPPRPPGNTQGKKQNKRKPRPTTRHVAHIVLANPETYACVRRERGELTAGGLTERDGQSSTRHPPVKSRNHSEAPPSPPSTNGRRRSGIII